MRVDGVAEGLAFAAHDADGDAPIPAEVVAIDDEFATATFYGVDLPVAITVEAQEGDVVIDDLALAPVQ
jgi:hypothetical protein